METNSRVEDADMATARKAQKSKQRKLGTAGLALMAMLNGGTALSAAGCSDSDELYPRVSGADVTGPDASVPDAVGGDGESGDDSPFYIPDEVTGGDDNGVADVVALDQLTGDTGKDIIDTAEATCETAQAKSFNIVVINGTPDQFVYGMAQDINGGSKPGIVDGCETVTPEKPNCKWQVEFNGADTGKTFLTAFVAPKSTAVLLNKDSVLESGVDASGGFTSFKCVLNGPVSEADLQNLLSTLADAVTHGFNLKDAVKSLPQVESVQMVQSTLQEGAQDDIDSPDYKAPGPDEDTSTTHFGEDTLIVVVAPVSQDALNCNK